MQARSDRQALKYWLRKCAVWINVQLRPDVHLKTSVRDREYLEKSEYFGSAVSTTDCGTATLLTLSRMCIILFQIYFYILIYEHGGK